MSAAPPAPFRLTAPPSDDVAAEGSPAPVRTANGPSLKARALALLARREHSRTELRRKLQSHATSPEALDAILDELQAGRWQSDERYVQGVVRQRAPREGARMIAQRLRQQGVDPQTVAEAKDGLRATENQRLHALWEKRYGQPPVDARDYARQFRHLAARGFAPEAIRRLLAGKDGAYAPDEDAPSEPGDC